MSFDGAIRDPSLSSSPNDEPTVSISGYLYKKTRDGRWQRRWFETNGFYLTYYKSKKMEKLLAALSLPQVGEITLVSEPISTAGEPSDGLFSIELNSRIYTLRGKDKDEAEKWVDTLRKLRDQGATVTSQISSSHPDNNSPSFNIEQSNANPKLMASETTASWIKASRSYCGCCCS